MKSLNPDVDKQVYAIRQSLVTSNDKDAELLNEKLLEVSDCHVCREGFLTRVLASGDKDLYFFLFDYCLIYATPLPERKFQYKRCMNLTDCEVSYITFFTLHVHF